MVAFHSKLDIERIVIFREFQEKQYQLFDFSHFKNQMLQFVDPITLNQLKDACLKVYNKKTHLLYQKCFLLN